MMDKLHIGCGTNYMDGYVNIDIDLNVRADYYCDMAEMPFDNDTFIEIYSHHSLEHGDCLFTIVDEMARVSRDQATWEIIVPYCTWTQGWGNPHHHILFHENTFRFFDKGKNGIHKRREQDYSIETVSVEYGWNEDLYQYNSEMNIKMKSPDDWFHGGWMRLKDTSLNVVKQITFKLKVSK